MLQKLASKPKKLFLVDSVGALLSVFLLSAVLARFEGTFGMPHQTLYILAAVALTFAAYSAWCYRAARNPRPHLRTIGIANLSYCCATIALLFYHGRTLTRWGAAYFIAEVLVVVLLACVELALTTKRSQRQPEH